MSDKRNVLVDMARVAAAVSIILCHVDLTAYGAIGVFAGQFLSVRFALMFFLAIIGYYVEKSYQAGKTPILKRVGALGRIYGMWSLIYLALSFVMLVGLQKMPLGEYWISRLKGFFFSGSYFHFWFYPAAIYALLFIGGVKRLLDRRALRLLVPLAVTLYILGVLGTGYCPIGRQIPGLRAFYAAKDFETIMHLALLGFPSVVFGMAAAHGTGDRSGGMVLLAAILYVAESVLLCMGLGWRENPQMLISTPLLTVLFLQWIQNNRLAVHVGDPLLLRTMSAGMYNVHPLFLAAFSIVWPQMSGLWAFGMCTAFSAVFGWMLYRLRKIRCIAWLI